MAWLMDLKFSPTDVQDCCVLVFTDGRPTDITSSSSSTPVIVATPAIRILSPATDSPETADPEQYLFSQEMFGSRGASDRQVRDTQAWYYCVPCDMTGMRALDLAASSTQDHGMPGRLLLQSEDFSVFGKRRVEVLSESEFEGRLAAAGRLGTDALKGGRDVRNGRRRSYIIGGHGTVTRGDGLTILK